MTQIHPTAIVDSKAEIGADVEIGAYCVLGAGVKIGNSCKLHSHVCVDGSTELGENCTVFPFAALGFAPQDLKYRGEKSRLVIGPRNVIREYVTMNPGTEGGGLVTTVGSDGLFMAHSHVAHDCQIGNHVIMANAATLAGHCAVEDHAILGGLSAAHQFVRVGAYAFIGGMAGARMDVIPFGMVLHTQEGLRGINLVGMRRHGFSRQEIQNVRETYEMLFSAGNGTIAERLIEVEHSYPEERCVAMIVNFIKSDTSRALLVPRQAAE
ncbi:MAG: acyl-ACP--UDP-N-acetylglucosamine O-acyltransferase [Pseudomonadota bacterium]|nr:acyl-ACP--UDP-N-acetylglucosamine O-acyltransferase [Pseudomonadota bacterium]